MAGKTEKWVSEQRVIELLECYGGDAENWPEEERSAASALIKASSQLQQRQHQARQLDEVLAIATVRQSLDKRADASVVANIMAALPDSPADNRPGNGSGSNGQGEPVDLQDFAQRKAARKTATRHWWTYSAAAAAAVVFLAIGIMVQFPSQTLTPGKDIAPLRTAKVSQEELDMWMWQDVTGAQTEELAADPDEEGVPVTFLAMVELDFLPEDE